VFVLAVDATGVAALIMAVATGIGTIVALLKTASNEKAAAAEKAAKAENLRGHDGRPQQRVHSTT
jgi:hypothetical protein